MDTPTPDNAARATPVAWVERTEAGLTRMWSGDLSAWAHRPANPEPLYSAATVAALEAEVADRNAVIECKNIDIRERDRSLHEWAERAKAAECRVAELEVGILALAERWRAEAVKLREQAGRALKRENAGFEPAVPHSELASAAHDAESYATELDALTGARAK